ncbi:hypothetical protein GCM10011325_28140 [Dyadobacter sediminis]|nr:hypothetical protein GCM10011325_28140 [Dyadobacter sediminis]
MGDSACRKGNSRLLTKDEDENAGLKLHVNSTQSNIIKNINEYQA